MLTKILVYFSVLIIQALTRVTGVQGSRFKGSGLKEWIVQLYCVGVCVPETLWYSVVK